MRWRAIYRAASLAVGKFYLFFHRFSFVFVCQHFILLNHLIQQPRPTDQIERAMVAGDQHHTHLLHGCERDRHRRRWQRLATKQSLIEINDLQMCNQLN